VVDFIAGNPDVLMVTLAVGQGCSSNAVTHATGALQAAREEAELVMFEAVERALQRTGAAAVQ